MLLHTIYLIAITAEAMTGALAAGRRKMDLVGVCMIGCITALGGGSCRDILLGHYPLGWVANPQYLVFTASAALVTAIIAPLMRYLRHAFLMLDALGLVAFTLIGCDVALKTQQAPIVVVLSGMITGTFGGILRDLLCNEVPLIFRRELYASIAVLTGCAYVLIGLTRLDHGVNVIVCLLVGFMLRMLAVRYKWNMPRFHYQDHESNEIDEHDRWR